MMTEKASPFLRLSAALCVLFCAGNTAALAQQAASPLTIEGLHQRTVHSAASAALGGMDLLARGSVASMLRSPASLATVADVQVSLGGVHRSIDRHQIQHYAPVRYYPNLGLLLEGLTHLIPDPPPGSIGFTPRDSVQRPLDDLGPNWEHSRSGLVPVHAFVAVPFDLGGVRLVTGFGITQYGDFDYYYQNNNALTPDVLAQRPMPTPRPTDNDPVEVEWYQIVRSRQGSIAGYGGALALEWPRHNLAVGLSGTFLRGSTDDFEQDVARGRLTFFSNAFRIDSLAGGGIRQGRSEFSGIDLAASGTLGGEHVTLGLTVRPPMTINRSFSLDPSSAGSATGVVAGEDRLSLPWRGGVSLMVRPDQNLAFGLDYELLPLGSAVFTSSTDEEHSPWLSSSAFRVGIQYEVLPWLALRGGMRREAEPFGAEGRPIPDEPVWSTAYTAGAGFSVAGVQLNLAYENRGIRYEDIMGSAIHFNRDKRHMLIADITYLFNWRR